MIDLDFFCWRFPVKDDEEGDRLVVARSDFWGDGDPVNLMWATAQEAIDWRDELLSELELECIHCQTPIEFSDDMWSHAEECPPGTGCYEGNEGATPDPMGAPAELSWVLVHYTGTVIGQYANPLVSELSDLLEACLETDSKPLRMKRGIELHSKLERSRGDNSLSTQDRLLLDGFNERLLVMIFGISPETMKP